MSDTVIRVENLGKKYIIGHQQQERYTALRDVLANRAKGITQLFNPKFSKKPSSNLEEFWALKDVSFEVKRGDRIGIIGRNGAGKSTLLKILSRITEPTEGRISIKGRVASLLEVGTGFHPELTGRENIYLNGAILGMSKVEIRRNFDEIVAFAEVEKFLDTPVKRYSSGMYVRLAFAVAAHLEPEILVVDEVLAVGDAAFQKKCLGKMEDVAEKDGRTVLFVSHNMAMIQNLCNYIIFLNRGQVQAKGEPNSMIQLYLNTGATSQDWSDLHKIAQRRGEGGLRFSKLELLDDQKNSINAALSGEPLGIRLFFSTSLAKPIFKNCRIGVAIASVSGVNIVLSTEMTCQEEVHIRDCDFIDFCIKKLPLTDGNYSLSLFAESNGIIQDWITEGIQFSVEGGDFYGTGKPCPFGYQGKSVLVDFSIAKNSYEYA
ncbi:MULTISPECIES: ABC transporter ATP-binding protein [Cyanophyceae]|uniref:ABC transporter ATP-binding protein n=1 Tax=Cyanophyceae TaxID=3028117 RepID=UPI001683B1A6|nr:MULTISPECIES: ABC transporter ATP-binding protein [Cyanophyceae]MBD1916307.1 ABC transporter ATP-binding protein [Phormidium sp. FACHB-77]MBD2032599.1 ABC transporter ATP-binding protein [Phormidium sp. FACHB-322]MBD2049971.1 ABC transporter ATP-binding protein [Leptolyngbya sp. FACHB-60]